MTNKEFIEKWNIAYDSKEEKREFSKEMEKDLDLIKRELLIDFSHWVISEIEKSKKIKWNVGDYIKKSTT